MTGLPANANIFTGDTVIDILKSSWASTRRFPLLASMGENSGYEWQLRAYMMLWDCPKTVLAYCMVSTRNTLSGGKIGIHTVDHIDSEARNAPVYERDAGKEQAIIERVQLLPRLLQPTALIGNVHKGDELALLHTLSTVSHCSGLEIHACGVTAGNKDAK